MDPRVTELRDRRVLVTGGSGFIGSHLTAALVDLGADVHVLTSAVSSVYPHRLTRLRTDIRLHEGNLTDPTAMRVLIRESRPDVVFHLGAYTHVGKSWNRIDECIQTNVQGTVNLLEALEGSGYTRFVNTGTSEIYGAIDVPFAEDDRPAPVSPYAVSKHAAEEFCRLGVTGRDWPIVRVRPFNAYGPAQSPDRVIPEIIVRGLRGDRLPMTTGRQTREFNHVADLVEGFVLAGVVPDIEGQLLNLGNGVEVTIADLVRTLLGVMGEPIEAEMGALPDRPIEIWRMCADATRAREVLGWTPRRSLRDGLAETVEWYRDELARPDSPFIPGFARGT
ncbi:MAG: GDP-mannose 4,6-dehydratase [Nitriliruptor sp.]|uniref:NAD-dependent epimerase/dehydratase family protein n=1 Tax=Nitriliruptor sp. TaxID=2448056 RepID=UPI0034A091EA